MIDWRHWHNEPYLIAGIVLAGWLWAILAGPLRPRLAPGELFPRGQAWAFYGSLLTFYLAVGSPLDQIGERFLFSAHMLQHQLLVYPAAILFLLGLPGWMVDGVLGRLAGRGAEVGVGATAAPRPPTLPRAVRLLRHPITCGLIYILVLSVWHMPDMYDWALRNKPVHVAEHLMFFGAALFYWWPMLSPSRLLPANGHGSNMLYFLCVEIGMTPLFAYITFSHATLYPTYEYAPRIVAGFSAGDDQLLAGTSMKLVGMAFAFGAIAISFYQWYRTSERRR